MEAIPDIPSNVNFKTVASWLGFPADVGGGLHGGYVVGMRAPCGWVAPGREEGKGLGGWEERDGESREGQHEKCTA